MSKTIDCENAMTEPMSDERLKQLKKLCSAASDGPWRVDHVSWKEVNDITVWKGDECLCNMGAPISNCGDVEEAEISYANGQFVAESRTAVPELIAEVERQRKISAKSLLIKQALSGSPRKD